MSKEDRGERLAKLMAARGVASRRESETLITKGLVTVNGEKVTDVATHVVADVDKVRIDGKPLPPPPPAVYYLFYKPRGCITGRNDPQERKTIFDLIGDIGAKVEPVGRLDYDTEGALLLTNDGTLAHKLTHPSSEVPKRYIAKVYRTPDERDLNTIRNGVFLEDGKTKPAKVRVQEATDKENCWVEVTVTEGRNRLIRRMFAQLGHPVSKLRRESFATLSIRGMERGQIRKLSNLEIQRLRELAAGRKPGQTGRLKYKKGFARPKPKAPRGPNKGKLKQKR